MPEDCRREALMSTACTVTVAAETHSNTVGYKI